MFLGSIALSVVAAQVYTQLREWQGFRPLHTFILGYNPLSIPLLKVIPIDLHVGVITCFCLANVHMTFCILG